MKEGEYVTLTAAARALGISRWTLYRRIEEGALPVYESPANRRVKLLRAQDVEALRTPERALPAAERDASRPSGEKGE